MRGVRSVNVTPLRSRGGKDEEEKMDEISKQTRKLKRAQTVKYQKPNLQNLTIFQLYKKAFRWKVVQVDSSNKVSAKSKKQGLASYKEFEKEESQQKERSSMYIFILLTIMGVGQMFQYCVGNLIVANLPGNKFYNGILMSSAEFLSMIFSRQLLQYMHDI